MKDKKLTFKTMLILLSLVPLAVAVVALLIANLSISRKNLEDQTKTTLRTAAADLCEYYEYDIINDNDLVDGWVTYDTTYLDHLKDMGVELTLFKGDTRFCTSIIGENGKRIEGTKASEGVIAAVIGKGEDYFSDDVVINKQDYYVYYIPIHGNDGSVVGMAFAGMLCDNVNTALRNTVVTIIIISVIVMAVFAALCIFLARKVSHSISACADSVERIADGDLSTPIEIKSILYETEKLIEASINLQTKLSDTMTDIKGVASDLLDSATEVSALSSRSSEGANQICIAMDDLTQGAASLAESVQNINEQTVEMGRAIETIGDNAEALVDISTRIKTANADAGEYIEKVSSSSIKSVEAVNDIAKQIGDTNDAIQRIKAAVDMISSVASQTNLLALNASIEAARAGDAGRGFAVVATEIGSLSEQSNSSASEIKEIVNEIIKKSEASVKISTEVASIIEEEQGYINETHDRFSILNTEIENSLHGISEISSRITDLDSSKDTIISAVSDLGAIAQENAASNEEVSASLTGIVESISIIAENSNGTDSKAKQLGNTVAYFK